jgi:VanZ family protein
MTMTTMTIKRAAAFGFWGLILVIGFLSLQPVENLPDVQIWDKLQHLVAYGALAFCGVIAYPSHAVRIIATTIAYGIAIEFAQGLVPGRQTSFGDGIANSLGAMMAALCARFRPVRRLLYSGST